MKEMGLKKRIGRRTLTVFEDEVLETIKKYKMIENGDKVVIGVSGGPDSMSLLNCLYSLKDKLKIEIYVAHINHMIRVEADEETEYVKEFCNRKGIEFFCKKIDVEKEAKALKIGTEEAGRNIRYEFFEEVAKKTKANKIATAHNSNDNAETVLMNLLRGTSVSGLKGIEKVRDGKFIRPIIERSRQEVEEYCAKENLNPKYDKSNAENIYTRNKVRNLLIPFIQKEFNPNILEGINRLSNLAADQERFIDNIVQKKYEEILIEEKNIGLKNEEKGNNSNEKIDKKSNNFNLDNYNGSNDKLVILDLKKFNMLDEVVRSRVILHAIARVYGKTSGIEKVHVDDILRLCSNNIGNKFLMPKKGLYVKVNKGKIFCKKALQ